MLPKPGGPGRRPIGLYPGFFRWWGRWRKGVLAEWEKEHCQTNLFNMASGRRVGDTVWRSSLRANLAKDDGK
eukprot:5769450-Prorocentrum_lima.AAC.1